jgi:hypothetical protein
MPQNMRNLYKKTINNMKNKKSFILYADYKNTVNILDDEIAGKLFKHILSYVNDENPQTDNIVLKIAFEPIKQQLKRDLNRWKDIKVKRSDAGKKSAEKRKQMSTSVKSVQQSSTSSTVNDNVNVNVNVSKDIYREFNHLSISQNEYLKLLEDYKKENIDDVLDSIENYKQNKKYKSLYLTAKNWLKRDHVKQTEKSNDPLVEYIKTQMNANR